MVFECCVRVSVFECWTLEQFQRKKNLRLHEMKTEDHLEDNRMGDDVDMYQKYLKLHESVKEMYLCTVFQKNK